MENAIRIDRAANTGGVRGKHALAFAGLYIFTLLLYARPNDTYPETFGTFPFVKIVAITSLVAYFASKLTRSERLTILPLELKMLIVIALLGIILAPIALSPKESHDLLMDLFLKVVVIFVLMINLIDTRKRLRAMMKLVVICGTVLALSAIRNYVAGDFGSKISGKGVRIALEVGGIFGNPNDLATSLDLLIPMAVVLALTCRGLARAAYFACAAILCVAVVVTFSRGGFLGLVAMGGMLLWKVGRRNRGLTALAFVIILGVFLSAMPGGYANRILTIFSIEDDPTGSAQLRRDQLERAFSVASNHLVFGVGMGNYHNYAFQEQRAHNSFLEIWAELGLAGLIAYLIMVFAPLRPLRRIERETIEAHRLGSEATAQREHYYLSVALQAAFIAYIVCSMFGSLQYLWYLFYPLAYAISLRRIYAAEQTSSATPHDRTKVVQQSARGVLWKPHQRSSQLSAVNRHL